MKTRSATLPKIPLFEDLTEEATLLAELIKGRTTPDQTLQILEAGCGNSWELDLTGIDYNLTGLDIDEAGLSIRKNEKRDLDEAIVGDLRTAELDENRFDVIYNSFVLEHIEDAERVLDNFIRWLKPGGILVLRMPDRHSVYGFLTRVTPFWVHVAYKRYMEGEADAGKPGFGPFPTVHEKIVSRSGIHDWCAQRGLEIEAEYGSNDFFNAIGLFAMPVRMLLWTLHVLSLGRLAARHSNLTYVIEKPTVISTATEGHDSEPACVC